MTRRLNFQKITFYNQPIKIMNYCHDTAEQGDRRLIELIEVRSYQIFASRAGEPGHALDDWLHAEREVRQYLGFGPRGQENSPDSDLMSRCKLPQSITLLLTWPI